MSEHKLHIIKGDLISKEELFAYIQNTLSAAEKLRIEKSMQDDPFLQDAVEGLKGGDIQTIEAALASIYGKVDAITATKKPQIFSINFRKYAAAASIILLLGMAWVIVDKLGSNTENNSIAIEPSINSADKNSAVIDDSSDMGGGSAMADSISIDEINTERKNQLNSANKNSDYQINRSQSNDADKIAEANAVSANGTQNGIENEYSKDETGVFSETTQYKEDTNTNVGLSSGTSQPAISQTDSKSVADDSKKDNKVKDKKTKAANVEYNADVQSADKAEATETKVYDFVEVMPAFKGGGDSLNTFIARNLISNCAPDKDCATGAAFVRFIVHQDGSLSDAEIVKTDNVNSNKNVLDVINKMPNWIPGMHSNNAVDVWYTIKVLINFN